MQPGRIIGGEFEILELLGSGASGQVYKATQLKLGRLVALKVCASERETQFLQRFHREGQILAGLRHKNICQCYLFGVEGRTPFMALELVEAPTLRSLLKEKTRFDWQECAHLLVQICAGLQAAHDAGIIHRDLKPENIMVTSDNTVKILDFGFSTSAWLRKQSLTQSGVVVGTPLYMSPEQLRGRKLTHHTDIYAAGCILFECLTGDLPFPVSELDTLLVEQERQAPRLNSLIDVPPGLQQIVDNAMAKNVCHRYQSAKEMAADLSSILNNPHFKPSVQKLQLGKEKIALACIAVALFAVAITIGPRLIANQQPAEVATTYSAGKNNREQLWTLATQKNNEKPGSADNLLRDLASEDQSGSRDIFAGMASAVLCQNSLLRHNPEAARRFGTKATVIIRTAANQERLFAGTVLRLSLLDAQSSARSVHDLANLDAAKLARAIDPLISELPGIRECIRQRGMINFLRTLRLACDRTNLKITDSQGAILFDTGMLFLRNSQPSEALCAEISPYERYASSRDGTHFKALYLLAQHKFDQADNLMASIMTGQQQAAWNVDYLHYLNACKGIPEYQKTGRADTLAKKIIAQAEVLRQAFGPKSPEYALALWSRADTYSRIGQRQSALADLNACESICTTTSVPALTLKEIHVCQQNCRQTGAGRSKDDQE
jgi:serine/threonine protein kinase